MGLTKKLIAKELSKNIDISNEESLNFLNHFINYIKDNSYSSDVKLNNFGTFYVHNSPKRLGRNPKTKESFIIPPRKKINFRASKKVKEDLN
tara:strand:- start:25 stop:300 length:276 start_codon:yes stop_codon:yes gene_type:complete